MAQIIMYIIQINNYYTTRSQMAAIASKSSERCLCPVKYKIKVKARLKYEERLFYERIK